MVKIVIAGEANCPYFAKIELLADSLQKNLPDFKLHKIVKHPNEWKSWLSDTCTARGFVHKKSPIVWRELVDRGGKGLLIGGANEFQEYVNGYYGIKSSFISDDMIKISSENQKTKDEIDAEERASRERIKPVKVCVTHASSPVCYHMMESIAKGEVLGPNTDISVTLLDTEDNSAELEGLKMEVYDLACPLLSEVTLTSDPDKAFSGASLIVLLDEIEGVEDNQPEVGDGDGNLSEMASGETDPTVIKAQREDWLKKNHDYFVNYAKIINEQADRDVRVIVGGRGPVNFNAYMMLQHMPNIVRQNVVAMSSMVERHAKSLIAERLKVNSADVCDVTVWGHSNDRHFLDMSVARVHRYDGAIWGPPSFSLPVAEMIHDEKWLTTELRELVKTRYDAVDTALGHRAHASHAGAITSLISNWWNAAPKGQMYSLGVQSEGWYGVPEGLVFSFPVTFHPAGYWTVVQDVNLTEDTKTEIQLIVEDLVGEKEVIYPPPYVAPPTPPPDENAEDQQAESQTDSPQAKSPTHPDDVALDEDGPSLGRITEDQEGEEKAASEIPARLSPEDSQTQLLDKDTTEQLDEEDNS